jgi:hypothetical protein
MVRADGQNQVAIFPAVKVDSVVRVNAGTVEPIASNSNQFNPQGRVAHVHAKKPESTDKLALQVFVVGIQFSPDSWADEDRAISHFGVDGASCGLRRDSGESFLVGLLASYLS